MFVTALVMYLAFSNPLALANVAASDEVPHSMESIRVADDGLHFVLAESGTTFVPWGFNYLGEFGKLMEETWEEEWSRIEQDFFQMRALGANVVRVHLQFSTYMKGPGEFDQQQLNRLAKLLDLARESGVYLDVTGLCCYRIDRVPAWYDALDESERWDAQAVWWKTIAERCNGHPAVFCYNLMNEPIVGGKAKVGEPRWLGGELGGFYFVQRISEDAKERTNIEIADAWASKLTKAIRQQDSRTLITVGVIPWAQVWPNAKPVFYSPTVSKHFDFVSVHSYPNRNEVEKAIAALVLHDIGKPLVVEETFPLNCTLEEMSLFVEGSKNRVDGWMSHYFGHTIEEHIRGAEPAGTTPGAPFPVSVADFLNYWREKGKVIASQSIDRNTNKPNR